MEASLSPPPARQWDGLTNLLGERGLHVHQLAFLGCHQPVGRYARRARDHLGDVGCRHLLSKNPSPSLPPSIRLSFGGDRALPLRAAERCSDPAAQDRNVRSATAGHLQQDRYSRTDTVAPLQHLHQEQAHPKPLTSPKPNPNLNPNPNNKPYRAAEINPDPDPNPSLNLKSHPNLSP